ncbi:MAG TPA: zinc-binding dehydrogenase [Candidatus Binatia bacterium]|nr:zinc-binding dehydrogenase [Candidatus Binatia bacterium]
MADRSVRGVRLRFGSSALNYHALRLIGPRLPRWAGGWMPWLQLHRSTAPEVRGPAWASLRPTLAGICGTDLGLLTGHASPILSPFSSFPAVLGHEVVAVVEEAGKGSGVVPGQRVVVDPVISCFVRDLEPCQQCREGHASLCERAAEGDLSPGLLIGYCRDLPGAWSDAMLAHASQLYPVPDALSDEVAVLIEPFSVALHAVLAGPPTPGDRVLVIGGGTLGLCTLAALRLIRPATRVTILVRHPAQASIAERLGAVSVPRDTGDGAIRAAESDAGARRYQPIVGDPVLTGGFDQVYDCVGSRRSLDAGLRVTAARGRLGLVGGPGQLGGLDWTLAWTRELRIDGSYVYGREDSLPERPHTFQEAMRLLSERSDLPLGDLVTHRFGLGSYRSAMAMALNRRRNGALKVVFAPASG